MDIDMIDADDLEDILLLEMHQQRQSNRPRTRVDPFVKWSDEEFKYKYRFTKRFAMEIVDLVRDDLEHESRGNPLSPELQVVCALRSWARHEIQDDTGDLHGVSQPCVSITCKNVAGALARLSHRYIRMPATLEEQEQNMQKFRSIANFPQVIGAIDYTHVRIKKINAEGGQLYINRKGYASINVQVICNADLRIMDIVTRWRGSVHDSRIFRESRVKQRFEAGAFTGLLLGDSGYPCTPYLFTPVLNPTIPQQERYNESHIRTRNTVERCFGLWKQRFRCLLRGMFCDIETARKTIVACAVLHNIALNMQEEIFPDNDEVQHQAREIVNIRPARNTIRGNVLRTQFINRHF